MRTRFLVGVAALLGGLGVAEQAHAESCNDMVRLARNIRKDFEEGDRAQQDALNELRNIQLQAQGCDAEPQNAIVAAIARVAGTPPPEPVVQPGTTPVSRPAPLPQVVQRSSIGQLAIGQTVTSSLTADSPANDGIAYEFWSFQAEAGQPLQISMSESGGSGLDTYLEVGRMRGGQFEVMGSNDDSGGTLNSQLRFAPDETGEYLIRARSFWREQYGAYDLIARASVNSVAVPRPLTLGEMITGGLSSDSAVEDGIAYDLWTFQAEPGQRLQISMTAPEGTNLDTYLVLGRMRDGEFVEIASNDDRGDGTFNSLVRLVPDEGGEYVIRARSFAQGQYGPYELIVQDTPFVVEARVPLGRNANGWVRQGELSAAAGDHVDYVFEAARGKRYRVQAFSYQFAPIVEVGLLGSGDRVTEVDFYAASDERASHTAEFRAERRGSYVLRVSALALASGHFDLIVSEVP